MNEATARDRLERGVQWQAPPALEPAEVDELLTDAVRRDRLGRDPLHVDYLPTWDLNYAIAAGWELKAAKLTGLTSFSADGATFDAEPARRACLEQARLYRARVGTGPDLVPAASGLDSIPVVRSGAQAWPPNIVNLPEPPS